jgi:uncharacterized membrane protein
MDEFVTRQDLRQLGADPRTIRKHLDPDAKLIAGTKEIELFKRDRVKALAAAIREAAERYAEKKIRTN